LKPAVCSRELCCWSFQQLGVGSEAASDIATEAEVVDLLVCFATIAAKSPRKELIFNPFPTVFNPNNRDVKVLDEKSKDFTLVTQLLTNMPSVEQMTQAADFSSMKESLDRAHLYCFPLLQWIINSNRSHIVQLNEGKQIKSMVTKHQYLLLSAPPEKEALFRHLKVQHGSTYAFHGSSIENWHSILRRGLLNASGSSLQVNGAAYGAGIYLSPSAAVSFGYSRMQGGNRGGGGGNRFLNANNMNCIAICEVIDADIRKNGEIWVQPHEDYVVTRFFCVYTGADPGGATGNHTTNATFKAEIEECYQHYHSVRG